MQPPRQYGGHGHGDDGRKEGGRTEQQRQQPRGGRRQPDEQPGERGPCHAAPGRIPVPAGDVDGQHGERAEREADAVLGGGGSGGRLAGGAGPGVRVRAAVVVGAGRGALLAGALGGVLGAVRRFVPRPGSRSLPLPVRRCFRPVGLAGAAGLRGLGGVAGLVGPVGLFGPFRRSGVHRGAG
jgi:hypothetical protein